MAFKLYGSRIRLTALKGVIDKHVRCVSSAIPHSFLKANCSHDSQKCSIHLNTKLYTPKIKSFLLSDIGEGIVEVAVKEWLVKPGDRVSQFDPICEVQSDKASVTISSRYDGIVQKLNYKVDDVAKVGTPLLDILTDDDGDDESPQESPKIADLKKVEITEDEIYCDKNKALATPAVRRIAKENDIKLESIQGTGKSGRVLKEDVLLYLESLTTKKPQEAGLKANLDRREEITGFRKAMAKAMENAWKVPHFSYCDDVVVNELVNLKPELKKISDSNHVKITFMPLFIKAASLALNKYPALNSLVDDKCEFLTVKSSHNIGVAMDTPNGLIVPNVKNVQNLSVVEIAKELNRLQELGVKGQMGMDDLKDGTFTLSNIGAIGGTYAKPIIFTPQVAIGALGKIQSLPRFDGEKNIIECHIFKVSWSADHRVIDGGTIAKFSNLWKLYLENPALLLHL